MNQRIKDIYDAATVLFLRQGYARTQISHIAKAAGISVGTIYHDFAGKQEIMHFVLKCIIDPNFINQDLARPITDSLFTGLEEEILDTFQKTTTAFAGHLDHIENYSFEALVSDAFDLLSRYGAGCLFIEKNQSDFVWLANYYKAYRKQFFDAMLAYINGFIILGVIRPLAHADLTTTLIIEILTWWAMDIRYVSFESCNISQELAKEVCMDNIITAYKINP